MTNAKQGSRKANAFWEEGASAELNMVLREQNQTGEARCDVELRNGASEDAAVAT